MSKDFRKVVESVNFRNVLEDKEKSFIYADQPYLGTGDNYQNSFTLQDTKDLFKILTESGIRFAMSEFRNETILELAKSHGLNVYDIKERQTLKSRNTEIIITNYVPNNQLSLF